MPVVTFLNRKGGVGKTSSCHHLAGTFAQMGKKVLLIDTDPQSSLTQGLLGPEETVALPASATIASIFAGEEPFPGQVIRTVAAGVDLIPGHDDAEDFDAPRPHKQPRESQVCLREFLSEVRDRYDYILIDCPPAVRLCAWAALAAADSLIVPLQVEDYGAQGIPKILDVFDLVREAVNPTLKLAGFLITMNNPRKAIQKAYEERIRGIYGDDVFQTVIPHATDFPEAVTARKPVCLYKPRSTAAKVMKALAEELEARMAVRSAA